MTVGEGQVDGTSSRTAVVLDALTNGLFRLKMQDGRMVTAHVGKDLRMAIARLLPGDPVVIDVSALDPYKARICKLLDKPSPSPLTSFPN